MNSVILLILILLGYGVALGFIFLISCLLCYEHGIKYFFKFKIPEKIFNWPKWRVQYMDTYFWETGPGLDCVTVVRAKDQEQAKQRVCFLQQGMVQKWYSVSPYDGPIKPEG
jgi:hypothetical protein